MNTIKYYDDTPYETAFSSRVISASPGRENGTLDVILEGTLFFPEEGGQTPDRGTLAGHRVLDVQIREGIITHTLSGAGESIAAGQTVSGTIDWEHRYSNMQNHTGEHILSGLLHSLYGYENVGFRLSDHTVTLDTSGQLSDDQILDLEKKANEVIWRNVPVTCSYPDPAALAALSYRSKKEIDGPVRIVTIEGVDACACCAPHVRRTGEIGSIRILDVLHTRTNMRLTIVCGVRAIEMEQARQSQVSRVSHLVNEPQETIADGVQRLLDQLASCQEEIRNLHAAYVDNRLQAIRSALPDDPSSRDEWIFESSLDNLTQRKFMNGLCDLGFRYAGVFVGRDETGYHYLIGGRGADARIINQHLKDSLGAHGGGKPDMVQGSVAADKERILKVLDTGTENN